jgi:hypothetical protein
MDHMYVLVRYVSYDIVQYSTNTYLQRVPRNQDAPNGRPSAKVPSVAEGTFALVRPFGASWFLGYSSYCMSLTSPDSQCNRPIPDRNLFTKAASLKMSDGTEEPTLKALED